MGKGPAYCGWCHPWTYGLGFYKIEGWQSHGIGKHSSIASASSPASSSLASLNSCPGFIRWWRLIWKCKPKKPLSLQVAWLWCFIIAMVTQTMPVLFLNYWKARTKIISTLESRNYPESCIRKGALPALAWLRHLNKTGNVNPTVQLLRQINRMERILFRELSWPESVP